MAKREYQPRNGESLETFLSRAYARFESAWRLVVAQEQFHPDALRGITDYASLEHRPDIHELVWMKPGILERFVGKPHGFEALTGPPAGGKDTVLNKAIALLPQNTIDVVVTHTTKPLTRPEDVQGKTYHYVSEEDFQALKDKGAFAEDVQQFGYYYGTSLQALEQSLVSPTLLSLWRGEYRGWIKLEKLLEARFPDIPKARIFMLPGTSALTYFTWIADKRKKEAPIQRYERGIFDVIHGGYADITILNPQEEEGPVQATDAYVAVMSKIREAELTPVVAL